MEKSGEVPNSMFNDAILALELLLHGECTQVSHSVAKKAYETIKAATIEQKRNVFWGHFFHNWTGALSDFIERAFHEYVQLGVAKRALIDEEPFEWAETNLRQFLEPLLGHKMSSPPESPDMSITFAEQVTGGQKAHNWVTYWIAEACAGEGQNLGDWMGEGVWELDNEAVDTWQAPAWLVDTTSQQSLESRLDARTTALEVGLVHFELWTKLEGAIEHAKLRATVDVVVSTDSAVEPDLQQSQHLRVYQAAEIAKVSTRQIYRWTRKGLFPVIWNEKQTRIIGIPRESFLQFLQGQLKKDS